MEGVESLELRLAREPGILPQLSLLFPCELRREVLCPIACSVKMGRLKTPLPLWNILLF